MPSCLPGTVIGYVVVCWNEFPGEWKDDWDGVVHSTFTGGVEALRECSLAGFTCVLTQLKRVGSGGEGT